MKYLIIIIISLLPMLTMVGYALLRLYRIKRQVRAFRQQVQQRGPYLMKWLPTFDEMVNYTLAGKALTFNNYFEWYEIEILKLEPIGS